MHGGIKMKTILISIIMVFVFCSSGFAQTLEERIKILEEALKKQEQTIKEQQKVIEELKAEMKKGKPSEQQQAAQPKEAPPLAAKETEKKPSLEQVQEQVAQLKEKVGQVVEAQKKNVLSVFNPAIGLVGETIFSYRQQAIRCRRAATAPAGSM